MSRQQIMTQTRAALDDSFRKIVFVDQSLQFKKPQQEEGLSSWIQEIEESIQEDQKLNSNLPGSELNRHSLKQKITHISNKLGPLSMLIFARLEKYYQILLNGTHQREHSNLIKAETQLKLNPPGYIGIPSNSDKFTNFIA